MGDLNAECTWKYKDNLKYGYLACIKWDGAKNEFKI